MPTISEALTTAVEHHQAGRLHEAESAYRQILNIDPHEFRAWHFLGVVEYELGKHDPAVAHIKRAVELQPKFAEAHYNLGIVLRAQGKLTQAASSLLIAITVCPELIQAHNELGRIRQTQGQLDEAIACFRRVLELCPANAEGEYNLGVSFQRQGKLDQAAVCYRRALELKPDFAEAHNNLGHVLQSQEKLQEAVTCFRRALELRPANAEAHNNLGFAFQTQAMLNEAIASYCRALALNPEYAEAHFNLGNAFQKQGKLDEAVACFHRALQLKSGYPEAYNNLGYAFQKQGKLDEAVSCFRRALEFEPDDAEVHTNLGNAFDDQGKLDEAIACHCCALELKPDFAEANCNLGHSFRQLGRFDDALTAYSRALELKEDYADAHSARSMLRLLCGDFDRGWPEYEWRWKTERLTPRTFPQPRWDGEPLGQRTILLHAEQGIGDTMQFIRYAALVKKQNVAATVILECPQPLATLLATYSGVDRLIAEGDELPSFDICSPLLSLPGIFKTTADTIPANVPYLFAEPALIVQWRESLSNVSGFRVGINWHGRSGRGEFRKRDIPLGQFAMLAEIRGITLVSLQKGAYRKDLANSGIGVFDPGEDVDTINGAFMDTAAIMMNLDLVITTDTSIPHLAGALGVPVWLALPYVPDWRWLLDRSDSPWYPTMQLFRQTSPGNWASVFEQMKAALVDLISSRAPTE